ELALSKYESVLTDYPTSVQAGDARRRMAALPRGLYWGAPRGFRPAIRRPHIRGGRTGGLGAHPHSHGSHANRSLEGVRDRLLGAHPGRNRGVVAQLPWRIVPHRR